MSHKKRDYSEECQICGGMIWKASYVYIEGAKVAVCQSCSNLGKKAPSSTSSMSKTMPPYKKPIKRTSTTKSTFNPQKREVPTPSLKVIVDYAIKVGNARGKSKLTQRDFALKLHEKESLIKSIESGKRVPTITLAKKIEKVFNINLTEKEDDDVIVDTRFLQKKQGPTTMGDMIVIKKKKKTKD